MTEIDFKSLNFAEIIKNLKIFIDRNICTACGLCEEICPFGLPQQDADGKYTIKDAHLCTECSACKRNCPVHAIVLQEQQGCGCLWDARGRAKNQNQSCNCG